MKHHTPVTLMTNSTISSPITAPPEGQTSNAKRQTPNFKRREARVRKHLAFGVWRLAFGVLTRPKGTSPRLSRTPPPRPRAAASHSRSALSFPKRRAFTLVEMLLVLVILAVLAAIVIPKFAGRGQQAKIAAAKTEIGTFKTALGVFEADNFYYPQTGAGLNALIEQPNNAKDWKGPYIDKNAIPLDPWGNAYIYTYPGKNNPKGFDIISVGPDGRVGGDDDITN